MLTQRDRQILEALCTKVRLFTLQQIATTWWADTSDRRKLAGRRLLKLAECELVGKQQLLIAPLPTMDAPVFRWTVGDQDPDAGAIAWQLQSRWKAGVRPTTVLTATARAARQFGGKRNDKRQSNLQATHDVGVSQMYLHRLHHRADQADRWIGEDILAPYRFRQKLPDAVIGDSARNKPELVLEFGGAYDKSRVQSFHDDCKKRELPYEIW